MFKNFIAKNPIKEKINQIIEKYKNTFLIYDNVAIQIELFEKEDRTSIKINYNPEEINEVISQNYDNIIDMKINFITKIKENINNIFKDVITLYTEEAKLSKEQLNEIKNKITQVNEIFDKIIWFFKFYYTRNLKNQWPWEKSYYDIFIVLKWIFSWIEIYIFDNINLFLNNKLFNIINNPYYEYNSLNSFKEYIEPWVKTPLREIKKIRDEYSKIFDVNLE